MPDQPRKRTSDREPTLPLSPSTTRDYDTISPSPRNTSQPSTSNNGPQDGTSGPLQKPNNARRASAERAAATLERQERSSWRAFWEKYGSVELENKGSVARDHLALGMLCPDSSSLNQLQDPLV